LEIVEGHLASGAWEPLLAQLKAMVDAGLADKAVEDADPRDAYRAHPELVLAIMRQRYVDLRVSAAAEAHASADYYTESVLPHYPDGSSSGSAFVDRWILEDLRALSQSAEILP
jgi:hypothetical protein